MSLSLVLVALALGSASTPEPEPEQEVSQWEEGTEYTPKSFLDAPAARPWYALGGFGVASYDGVATGPALKLALGRVWWDRGLGLEVQGQLVMSIMGTYVSLDGDFEEGSLSGKSTGGFHGGLLARFRFGKTSGRRWIHGIVPLGLDFLTLHTTRFEGGDEVERRGISAWLSSGIGVGFQRRFGKVAFVGFDLTATAGLRLNETYNLYGHLTQGGNLRVGGVGMMYFGGNF